jgi:hypothetical protein
MEAPARALNQFKTLGMRSRIQSGHRCHFVRLLVSGDPFNRFLKAKIAPKLDECVNRVVNTYAGRKELDVLKPLDGFFRKAFGPDWHAKLPKFEFAFDYHQLNAANALAFIGKNDVFCFGGCRNPAFKIRKFLDAKCKRIQAFKDVAVIELVNAIHCESYPDDGPPPRSWSGSKTTTASACTGDIQASNVVINL